MERIGSYILQQDRVLSLYNLPNLRSPMLRVTVQQEAFDPYEEMNRHQESLPQGKYGAAVSFIGSLRDFNEGDEVSSMYLEHYPGMTERSLEQVCRDASEKWDILNTLVIHRVGELHPGEAIVLVGVWSEHRSQAFDACRYIINELKTRAPFWKRETTLAGYRWVERNTDDHSI